MKEIGVMFSAPMVLAIGRGDKRQTRRLASSPLARVRPGTVLWVRETWRTMAMHDKLKPVVLGEKYQASAYGTAAEAPILYEADQHRRGRWPGEASEGWKPGKCRPAIHMPRFAARFGLRLEAVRTESVQEISEADAIAEGLERQDGGWKSYETYADGTPHPHASVPNRSPVTSYRELWQSLHRRDGERWEENPLVAVLSFELAWVDK